MPSVGQFEFPEIAFSECLAVIEKVKRDKVQTFDTLVGILGYSNQKSSGVGLKMGALNKYFGLLVKDGNSIKLTPLGERIVYDLGGRTRDLACAEAVNRVALFKALYSRLGSEYHSNDFKPVLHDVTGAKPEEIEEKADRVEALYRDALPYLRQERSGALTPPATGEVEDRGTGAPAARPGHSLPPSVESLQDYHVYQTGDSYVRLKKDPEVLEVAKGVIEVWLARAKSKPTAEPGSSSGAGG